jgi:hypothetical protein
MLGHSVKHHVVYVMLNDDDNGFVFAGDVIDAISNEHKGRRGSDRTVVGIKTTYATNAYHH